MYFSAILIISDINITLYITINIYIKLLEQESLSSIQIKSKQIIYIYEVMIITDIIKTLVQYIYVKYCRMRA